MSFGSLFSAVVKPEKPLLYICDESTHITNIAVCPADGSQKNSQKLSTLPPFVTVLKLQYEGPVIEGEHDDDEKENVDSKKSNGDKADKTKAKTQDQEDGDEGDEDEDDSDFDAVDIEAKEVVVGTFTPNIMQITTDLYLAPNDQYRFVLSGSSDYEIHLLGRYIPDSRDYPPTDSEEDSDDDDELYLNEIPTDEEGSDGPRIEELSGEEDEPASKPKKITNAPAPTPSKNAPKPNDVKEKKANKRPLEDKEADADVSMADSAAGSTTEGGAKLSKAQRKKLKKAKLAEVANVKDTTEAPKSAEASKASESKESASTAAPKTVTLPSGLKIIDSKIGTGIDAKPGQSISMRYIGKLANGTVFDSNTKGKPFNFKLGAGQVIKGWDEGIKGMKLGGERKLIIPANLAYGKSGSSPQIPANATLTFEVKLLAIK